MAKTQKDRVYRAVKKVLGEKFKEGMDVRPLLWPEKCTGFPRGPRGPHGDPYEPPRDNPYFLAILLVSDLPRNTVCNWLRRDPRLNGGKKRNWKGVDGNFQDEKLQRLHSLVMQTQKGEQTDDLFNEIRSLVIEWGFQSAKIDFNLLPMALQHFLKPTRLKAVKKTG